MDFHSRSFYLPLSDFARTRIQDVKAVLKGEVFSCLFQDAVSCHIEESWLQKKKI